MFPFRSKLVPKHFLPKKNDLKPILTTTLRKDADPASVRDPDALSKHPEDERQSRQSLWADVAALFKVVRLKSLRFPVTYFSFKKTRPGL
jgi:hypothetical protein